MPEGVGYGPQFTASTGLSLNYIGRRVYAYSGVKDLDTNFQDYLNFTTGKEIIICEIHIIGDYDSLGGNDMLTNIYLNGIVVVLDDSSAELAPYSWPIKLILPPLTHVKIEGKVSSGSGKTFGCTLIGKID